MGRINYNTQDNLEKILSQIDFSKSTIGPEQFDEIEEGVAEATTNAATSPESSPADETDNIQNG